MAISIDDPANDVDLIFGQCRELLCRVRGQVNQPLSGMNVRREMWSSKVRFEIICFRIAY